MKNVKIVLLVILLAIVISSIVYICALAQRYVTHGTPGSSTFSHGRLLKNTIEISCFMSIGGLPEQILLVDCVVPKEDIRVSCNPDYPAVLKLPSELGASALIKWRIQNDNIVSFSKYDAVLNYRLYDWGNKARITIGPLPDDIVQLILDNRIAIVIITQEESFVGRTIEVEYIVDLD